MYIYGPLNYNPVEEWFFHRIKAGRPIPVPGSGMEVSPQLHIYGGQHSQVMVAGVCRTSGLRSFTNTSLQQVRPEQLRLVQQPGVLLLQATKAGWPWNRPWQQHGKAAMSRAQFSYAQKCWVQQYITRLRSCTSEII